jgi:hypothetical protein
MKRLLLATVACAACGSDANVAGTYTVASTNRDNGCMFQNWTVGAMSTGIGVEITQSGSNVTASITGGAGLVFDAVLGGHAYTGSVSGSDISLELFGTRSMAKGNCTFTYNSTIDATSHGDAIEGRIEYTPATNGNPDCATINGCVSFQDFNGTRPPR